ncbi:MAG: hypothetical protein EXQ58_12550 [Acidobacteria bacterium]|nr:hypothetical protein [Acidobacteriota bacterium]
MLSLLLRQSALAGTLFLLLGSVCQPQPTALLAAQESLSAEEKETLQQAKDPEQQLKLWLGIAESRLKAVILHTRKLDKANSAKAMSGYRTAVTSAEDCVAKEQGGKNHKRLLTQLHKAVKKYNFALLQALDKAAEDFRQYIQSAFEASQRVQDAAEIQMARFI